jgi:hypothetical protein
MDSTLIVLTLASTDALQIHLTKVSYSPVLSKGFHDYLTPGPALGERDRVVRRLRTA